MLSSTIQEDKQYCENHWSVITTPARFIMYKSLDFNHLGLDIHFRNSYLCIGTDFYLQHHFISDHLNSFYSDFSVRYRTKYKRLIVSFGLLGRFTHIHGYYGTNDTYETSGEMKDDKLRDIYKIGIGMSFGGDFQITNHLFVGSNCKIGSYLTNNNNKFHGEFLSGLFDQDPCVFVTLDLLLIRIQF